MSTIATSKAWFIAASVRVVEASKDQGICRWNHTIRSVHHRAKKHVSSFSQVNKLSSSSSSSSCSSSSVISSKMEKEKAKQSEDSIRKVMYLSCWGPNQ